MWFHKSSVMEDVDKNEHPYCKTKLMIIMNLDHELCFYEFAIESLKSIDICEIGVHGISMIIAKMKST